MMKKPEMRHLMIITIEGQHGFVPHKSTQAQLLMRQQSIYETNARKEKGYCLF